LITILLRTGKRNRPCQLSKSQYWLHIIVSYTLHHSTLRTTKLQNRTCYNYIILYIYTFNSTNFWAKHSLILIRRNYKTHNKQPKENEAPLSPDPLMLWKNYVSVLLFTFLAVYIFDWKRLDVIYESIFNFPRIYFHNGNVVSWPCPIIRPILRERSIPKNLFA